MDEKKKEWIKKNLVSMVTHCLILVVYMTFTFTLLEWYSLSLSNVSMLHNIFASVTVFGSLTFFTLLLIYMEMWMKRIREFKQSYKKHMEK